jgi:hypothetical protein
VMVFRTFWISDSVKAMAKLPAGGHLKEQILTHAPS